MRPSEEMANAIPPKCPSSQLGCLARQPQRQRFSLPRGPRAQLCRAAGAQQSHGKKRAERSSPVGTWFLVGNWRKNLRKYLMENPINLMENLVEIYGKSLTICTSSMMDQWDLWWKMQVLGWCPSHPKWGDRKTWSKARVKRWAKACSGSVQQACLRCETTDSCAQTIWFSGQWMILNDGLQQDP